MKAVSKLKREKERFIQQPITAEAFPRPLNNVVEYRRLTEACAVHCQRKFVWLILKIFLWIPAPHILKKMSKKAVRRPDAQTVCVPVTQPQWHSGFTYYHTCSSHDFSHKPRLVPVHRPGNKRLGSAAHVNISRPRRKSNPDLKVTGSVR